ncbi:hypothetical protein AVMA1855_24980 [Acidovorax sp. SUPP1855]|uniref:hypothetical protein n=1 Tax=Acidovorax sp. SUPP1855 TaxID=431774 RepID=UPI0023DE662B|nr:hypothetical protein [Acidovorax sp. SUPP1855]GKS87470.1 hypothetical protein AVMA1855_24980 [Acidovorax sp. SUPP1855]
METKIYKDRDGWNAKTVVPLDERRELVIRTSRRQIGGGLLTSATCWSIGAAGSQTHVMGYGTGDGDFSTRIVTTQPPRITEKVVAQQHEMALRQIDAIRQAAQLHYAAQVQAETEAPQLDVAEPTQPVVHAPSAIAR